MKSIALLASVVVLTSLGSAGCGRAKTPAELETGLASSDPVVRRTSADDLRSGGRVPADALPKLYEAIDKEHDAEAYGAMILTLGVSGDLGAKSYVCGTAGGEGINDARVSRWQYHALQQWLHINPDQGGCQMSAIEEVPVSQGPQHTKTKPIAPLKGPFSPGM